MAIPSQRLVVELFQAIFDDNGEAAARAVNAGASPVATLGAAVSDIHAAQHWRPEENATPIRYAAKLNRAKILRWLLTLPEAASAEDLGDLLILTIAWGNEEAARALVEDGGPRALTGKERQWKKPPLGLAAEQGWDELARILLRTVDPMERDRGGNTPLILAGLSPWVECAKVLLGALSAEDVNAQNNRGETAMMRACAHGNYEVVRALLADGRVRLDLREKRGRNALQIALAADLPFGSGECAALLAGQSGDAEAISEWAIAAIFKISGEKKEKRLAEKMELLAEWMSAEAARICSEKLGRTRAQKLHAKAETHDLGQAVFSKPESESPRGEEAGGAGTVKNAQSRRL